MTSTATLTKEEVIAPALLARDRCDKCGAQAVCTATKDDLMLLFCMHHLHKYADGLDSQGFYIHIDAAMMESLCITT